MAIMATTTINSTSVKPSSPWELFRADTRPCVRIIAIIVSLVFG